MALARLDFACLPALRHCWRNGGRSSRFGPGEAIRRDGGERILGLIIPSGWCRFILSMWQPKIAQFPNSDRIS